VTTGMPIGPPSHKPAPKSACIPVVAPMLVTYACELASTGRLSTRRFQMLSPGNTGQPPMPGPPLVVGTTVAVAVAVGLALGTPATVTVLVAVTVAAGVLVRVAVPVGAGELVEVRVGVPVAMGTGVRVLVAVAVADGVAVRVGTRVVVGVGRLVGVRVGVAVARGRNLAAASECNALSKMNGTARTVSERLQRRFITISLPESDGTSSRVDLQQPKGMPRDMHGARARSRSTAHAPASFDGRSSG